MSVESGRYFVEGEQPPLSSEEDEIVRRFHELYYRRWLAGADTINLSWFGHQLLKCPFDVWLYQELLVRNRPDVVVETGTWQGGSALFLAMILEQIGHGRVITVDTESRPGRPQHPRISYLTGSSIDPAIVAKVYDEVGGGRAMVILDSDHKRDHVYSEILAYSPLVRIGGYLIVEDTNVNGHPAFADYGPGPMEAVAQFLSETGDFVVDERCERFMMTLNPRGYLRRVTKASASQAASSDTPAAPSAVPGAAAAAQSSAPGPQAATPSNPQMSMVVVVYNIPREALRDFINLEAYCGPKSVILFHDTVPLDEPTQRRTCETTFHTGDVWKIVPTLKELRPDLDIFTISTAWTGLTVVTGLDPSSRVLKESYDSAVAKFADLPFSAIEEHMASSLNMVPNDWTVVETRLKARGVL